MLGPELHALLGGLKAQTTGSSLSALSSPWLPGLLLGNSSHVHGVHVQPGSVCSTHTGRVPVLDGAWQGR